MGEYPISAILSRIRALIKERTGDASAGGGGARGFQAMAAEQPLMLMQPAVGRLMVVFCASAHKATKLFESIDETGSGVVLRGAFRKALPELHISAKKHEADALFDELDVAGRGELPYADIEKVCISKGYLARSKVGKRRRTAVATVDTLGPAYYLVSK